MIRQVYLCIFILLLWISTANASHIVGGEFSMQAVGRGYNYQFNLHLYFDVLHGDPKAEDASIFVAIYSKATNKQIDTLTLYRVLSTPLSFTNPLCTTGNTVTKLIRYSRELTLDPKIYREPAGYYITWERCCRNEGIVNIAEPGNSGITFYMEFPPVAVNGSRFTNTSPAFAPLTGNYACVNELLILDFSATDDNRDSLVYALITPLKGHSNGNESVPAPIAAPYPDISWTNGYGLQYILNGSMQLNAATGEIRMKASKMGLYAFAVRCEEFRNGLKIGEVRRDYQIMVLDCQQNMPPNLSVLENKDTKKLYQEGNIMHLAATDERCFPVLVTDKEIKSTIQLSILSANFPLDKATLTPITGTIQNAKDTLQALLCLDKCLKNPPGEFLQLTLVATDSGCPIGKADTVLLKIDLAPKPNEAPEVYTTLAVNQATLPVDSMLTFEVIASDMDKDMISLKAVGRGFELEKFGMSFTNKTGTDHLQSSFTWKPICTGLADSVFIVDFIATDLRCSSGKQDTVTVTLLLEKNPNKTPQIFTSLTQNAGTVTIGEEMSFDVTGIDADNEPVEIWAVGRGFDLQQEGMHFEIHATSLGTITIPFYWQPNCNNKEGSYTINFIITDHSCSLNKYDTVTVTLSLQDFATSETQFLPPNVFTPNEDGVNDYFEIPNLPTDNCNNYFTGITIYNRWGKLIFEDTKRNFQWKGENMPTGTYFYLLQYSTSKYKGIISLLR
jgi:gliding motility-associated-like protein